MWDVLPDRVPWYIAGPGIGLLVAGLFAVANAPLGVSGSYLQTFSLIRRRADTEVWRVWYFGGLVAGALVRASLPPSGVVHPRRSSTKRMGMATTMAEPMIR